MLRHAPLFTAFLLVGCASPRASGLIVDEATVGRAIAPRTEAPPVEAPAAHEDSAAVLAFPAPESEAPNESTLSMLSTVTPPQMQQQPPPRRQPPQFLQRFTLKGGYYGSNEDEFDDGYNIIASWMRFTSPVFASEVEIGYLDASGTHKGVDRDVWSIPFMANARLNLPLGEGKIELYGGLGLGTFYFEADAKTPGVKVNSDGFLFGGDAYFGGTIHLGEDLFLGVESKYYATDNDSDLGGSLDAYVLMLTLGFGR